MDRVIVSGCAGGIAGIMVDLIYFPIETIKIRIQASNSKVDYIKSASSISKYKGVINFCNTVHQLLSQISVSFPAAFIFFFFYEKTKQKIAESKPLLNSSVKHMMAASVGEFMANIFRNPIEVIKNQMQVGLDPTIRQTFRSIVQRQGFVGFYAGIQPVLMREIPFSSIQFPIYERMTKRSLSDKTQLDLKDNIINGGTAGGLAAFLTTPCDVIKSKMMTQRGQFYKGVQDCISQVYKDDGIKGFFKATHYRTLQIGSSGIIFFGAYEKAKSFLNKQIITN